MAEEHNHEEDECLELLYHLREKHDVDVPTLREHDDSIGPELLARLASQELILLEGEKIALTETGLLRSEGIIRRHRLAERLLADVLHMKPAEIERGACEFEHLLAEEITESICTLLGHPRTCPHGSPIPEGACCRAAAKECPSAVVPLNEAPLGVWARVAYIASASDERQHRLMHFGIVPGTSIKVHQLKPSVVVMLPNSRLAMEETIARDIYVWRRWQEAPTAAPPIEAPLPRRWFRFWR